MLIRELKDLIVKREEDHDADFINEVIGASDTENLLFFQQHEDAIIAIYFSDEYDRYDGLISVEVGDYCHDWFQDFHVYGHTIHETVDKVKAKQAELIAEIDQFEESGMYFKTYLSHFGKPYVLSSGIKGINVSVEV